MADISLTQDLSLEETEDGVNDNSLHDLVTDEEALLPPFVRVQKYATSENVYDRQMVSRILVELFRVGPTETVTADVPKLMELISRLAEEDEIMVRTDLLEQIPNLAAVAAECSLRIPSLTTLTKEYLLPLVVRNLGSAENQVRKTAHSTLFTLLEQGLVTRQQAEIQVCPTVLAFTRMERLLDYHTSAVTLMSKLAPLLGQEITERVFLDRFAELCSNEAFHLRKVCASHFGDFCYVVGTKAYETVLLPLFVELCKDDNWGVRKACAEVVMSVSCACPPAARKSSLAPVFAQLLQDDSRWVRMSAFQTLGPFISTFADPTITSLGYNQMGELVLVNTDGAEFRINSPPFSDYNVKAVKEFHKFFYQSDSSDALSSGNGMNSGMQQQNCDLGGGHMKWNVYDPFNQRISDDKADAEEEDEEEEQVPENDEDSDDEDDEDIVMNPLPDSLAAAPDAETVINVNGGAGDNYANCDNNRTEKKVDEAGDRKDENSNESEDPVSELVEGVESITFEHGYSVVGFATSTETVNNSKNAAEETIDCEEDLEKYNSHRYWYVSPDLPLDPEIIDAGRTTKRAKKNTTQQPSKQRRKSDSNKIADLNVTNNVANLVNSIWNEEKNASDAPSGPSVPTPTANDVFVNRSPKATPYAMYNPMAFDTSEMLDMEEYLFNSAYKSSLGPGNHPASSALEQPHPDTSQQHLVPQLLVDHFISMTDPSLAQNTDNDMAYHCAYSLPGVALTLGVHNWHLLKRTVELLAYDMQYKVRRTVASSLHELALILGQDIATSCLAPIFEGFLKDLDEVRIGMLKHLAHFLKLINPRKRNSFLPRLGEFIRTDNEWNWRFREELAEQLLVAVTLFQPGDASKHISVVAQDLLCDKVAAVRAVAIKLVTELVRHTLSSTESDLVTGLLIKIATQFAHSKRWKRRQVFALLCSDLMTTKALPGEQFAADVMPHLLDLSWDPVPNVRLVVAKTIARDIITNAYFSEPSGQKHYEDLQLVLRRLQTDKDRDVRQSALVEFYTNPIH